jgi:transposase
MSMPRCWPRCWRASTGLSADIEDLTAVIERLLAPYEEQLQQAESMPGWGRRAAQDAVAETGVDMSRFRTGPHLVSWGGRAPARPQRQVCS